jgi:hypothetical protein
MSSPKDTLEDYPLPSNHSEAVDHLVDFGQRVFIKTGLYPITFSTLDIADIRKINQKTQVVSEAKPGEPCSQLWGSNKIAYYDQYQKSMFAYTWRKGGWDCNRHVEILRNGCVPYMHDIGACPPYTMALYPKKTMLQILALPGFNQATYETTQWPVNWKVAQPLTLDEKLFDKDSYQTIVSYLLKYTYYYLNPQNHIDYILTIAGQKKVNKILCLYNPQGPGIDYLGDTLFCHLCQRKDLTVVDYPQRANLYWSNQSSGQFLMGYLKGRQPPNVTPDDLLNQIQNHEYDMIWYMDAHHGLPMINTVTNHYQRNEIIILSGGDGAVRGNPYNKGLMFVRELMELPQCPQINLIKPIQSVTYGWGSEIVDVTKAFKDLCNLEFFFFYICNDFVNHDPAPFKIKQLIITFEDQTQISFDEHTHVHFNLGGNPP